MKCLTEGKYDELNRFVIEHVKEAILTQGEQRVSELVKNANDALVFYCCYPLANEWHVNQAKKQLIAEDRQQMERENQ